MQNITPAVEYFVVQCSMHSDVKTWETRFRRATFYMVAMCNVESRERASDGSEISDIHTRSGSRDRNLDHVNLHDPPDRL